MRNIKIFLGLIVTAALLWWLYPESTSQHAGDKTEVTVWFGGLLDSRHIDVVDAFERDFPEYFGVLGSSATRTGLEGEGNPQRLMCGIAGGVPPEVVEYDRFAICQWASRDAFLDLYPLIQKDQDDYKRYNEELATLKENYDQNADRIAELERKIKRLDTFMVRQDDYYEAPWGECEYQGGLYGIPTYMDNRTLFFNSDLLVQVGMVNEKGEPRPPDTWEEILSKIVDIRDAKIQNDRIYSETADFVKSGVKPGDTVSHIADRGRVTRCLVKDVVGPKEIVVESPYVAKDLNLFDGSNQRIKIFDQKSFLLQLTRWDEKGALKCIGFEPNHGNGWLFHYGWANGGQFLSDDGRTCTLDDPKIIEALEWTTDVYDAMGGAADVNAFKKSFQGQAQDPFYHNQIAMFITGDWFLRDMSRYARDMRFGVHYPPVPESRKESYRKLTWIGGYAYCIPATCPKDKLDAAWWMVKFLSSVRGGMVMNEHDAQRERAQGRIYMPRIQSNKDLQQTQWEQYVDIPEMPTRIRDAMLVHMELLPYSKYRPVSPEGLKLWNAQADAQDLSWNHAYRDGKLYEPEDAVALTQAEVQRGLDAFYSEKRGKPVNWTWLAFSYLALLVAVAYFCYWRHKNKYPARGIYRREWLLGPMFASPWIIGFIILTGGPMIFSLFLSFTQYDVISPARFVGLDNYHEMFTTDWGEIGGVKQALLNTLFMGIGLPVGMAVGLGLAMLLNLKVKGISIYRTTFFLPAIMPVVAASVLWIWVFNAQNGLMNWMLHISGIESLVDMLGVKTPISWLTNKATSKPALIIMGLWAAGASMIIWLAGLKEIPTHLYEASALDGAGPLRRFKNVTLPLLSPYILFNLVMGLIQTFQIFTQAYIMTPNGSPQRSTYFFVYKLFDECFSFFRLGYGAAMAWVLFAIVIVLTLFNMAASKRWVHYAGD